MVHDLLLPATARAATPSTRTWGDEIADPTAILKHDDRTPDIIVVPEEGVIHSTAAQAEHGGSTARTTAMSGLLVANPHLRPGRVDRQVSPLQISPTILWSMGLDPCTEGRPRGGVLRRRPAIHSKDHATTRRIGDVAEATARRRHLLPAAWAAARRLQGHDQVAPGHPHAAAGFFAGRGGHVERLSL